MHQSPPWTPCFIVGDACEAVNASGARTIKAVEEYCSRFVSAQAETLTAAGVSVLSRLYSLRLTSSGRYKAHGFVTDVVEAKQHRGEDWIKTETPELKAAEEIYSHLETVNFFLEWTKSKYMFISGGATLSSSVLIFDKKK